MIYSAETRTSPVDGVPREIKQIVGEARWNTLKGQIKRLFGVELDPPKYITERGEIEMTYKDASGVRLDISSSGRGLQQTLLLLSHLKVNPGPSCFLTNRTPTWKSCAKGKSINKSPRLLGNNKAKLLLPVIQR